MAHLVCLAAFVLLSLVPQVAAIPGADLAADGDEQRMMAEENLEDLRDPNQPEQEDATLSNPFVSSILYRILQSEAALRRRQQQELPQENAEDDESGDFSDEVNDVSNDNNDEDGVNVVKRVFCNNFTGCGGRFRRRRILRKRPLPVLVKRRFCTSFGCFKTRPDPTGGFPRSRFTSKGFARGTEEGVVGGRGQERDEAAERKRLFCNGYGGCRGGKRSLFSPWMSKMNSVADSLR